MAPAGHLRHQSASAAELTVPVTSDPLDAVAACQGVPSSAGSAAMDAPQKPAGSRARGFMRGWRSWGGSGDADHALAQRRSSAAGSDMELTELSTLHSSVSAQGGSSHFRRLSNVSALTIEEHDAEAHSVATQHGSTAHSFTSLHSMLADAEAERARQPAPISSTGGFSASMGPGSVAGASSLQRSSSGGSLGSAASDAAASTSSTSAPAKPHPLTGPASSSSSTPTRLRGSYGPLAAGGAGGAGTAGVPLSALPPPFSSAARRVEPDDDDASHIMQAGSVHSVSSLASYPDTLQGHSRHSHSGGGTAAGANHSSTSGPQDPLRASSGDDEPVDLPLPEGGASEVQAQLPTVVVRAESAAAPAAAPPAASDSSSGTAAASGVGAADAGGNMERKTSISQAMNSMMSGFAKLGGFGKRNAPGQASAAASPSVKGSVSQELTSM